MAYRAPEGVIGSSLVKDQFKGERVFAVCNGPSLDKVNWDWLKDEYLWGCGLSIDVPQVDHFDFYSVTEQARLPVVVPKIEHLDIPKFYNRHWEADDLFKNYGFPNDTPPPGWRETEARHVGVDTVKQFGFSTDLDWVCHMPEASVISGVLQPALWLGFTEIYLLGADFSGHYTGDGPGKQGTRNVHPNPWIAYVLNAATQEAKDKYPGVRFANLGDKNANPILHSKFGLDMEYTTLEQVIGKSTASNTITTIQ